jgi:hypothetical protein
MTKNGEMLPRNYLDVGYDNDANKVPLAYLFAAGDVRANENPGLTTLHTIFVREHNRQCKIIKQSNPGITGEQAFQKARRWVIALLQRVTFQEYIPATLGGEHALSPYTGYDPNVDATIDLLFATALFRYGHSEVLEMIPRMDENGVEIPQGSLHLKDCYFNPLCWENEGPEPIINGMTRVPQMEVDAFYVDAIRNFLFGSPDQKGIGSVDLGARNIQRGRDHGIPSYNDARAYFHLPVATSFSDITSNASLAAALSEVYNGDINAVDAYVGGLAEDHKTFPLIGDLMGSALKYQYECLRNGDRFYFENTAVTGFTEAEVQEIKSTKLSDIVLRNTNIQKIPCGMMYANGPLCGSAIAPISSASNHLSLMSGLFNVSWTITPATGKNVIDGDASATFTIVAKTSSWAGVGFNSQPQRMPESDVYAGWVYEDGVVTMGDYKIGAKRKPTCDTGGLCLDVENPGGACTNNIDSSSGHFVPGPSDDEPGTMTLTFTRKLDTGDKCDEVIVPGNMNLVAAMGVPGARRGLISFHQDFHDDLVVQIIPESSAPVASAPLNDPIPVPTTPIHFPPVAAAPSSSQLTYTGNASLFPGHYVNWTVVAPPGEALNSENATLFVTIVAQTDSWAGFGFNPDERMINSDAYVGIVQADGSVKIDDYKFGPVATFGCANGGVCLDTDQACPDNILSASGHHEPAVAGAATGTLTINFSRKIATGDARCDYPVTYGTVGVVSAMGKPGAPIGRITGHGANKKASSLSIIGDDPNTPPPISAAPVSDEPIGLPPDSISHQDSVNMFPGYDASWTIWGATATRPPIIEVHVTAHTDSWAGFGFNVNNQMIFSDVYVAIIQPDGNITMADYKIGDYAGYGCDQHGVCRDVDQGCTDDILRFTATHKPARPGDATGLLIFSFARYLTTGDSKCDFPLVYGSMPVVAAMGPPGAPLGKITSHKGNKNVKPLVILGESPVAEPAQGGNAPTTAAPQAPAIPQAPICAEPSPNEFPHSMTALGDRYKLYWKMQPVESILELALVGRTTGWVGFGISQPGVSHPMIGSEAIIGWPGSVNSYKLNSQTDISKITIDPAIKLDHQCSAQFTGPDGHQWTVVRATRNVVAGNNKIAVGAEQLTPIVIALGQPDHDYLSAHDDTDMQSLSVDFSSGKVKAAKPDPRKVAHGVLMFISWGITLQFGAFFARYAKPLPSALWFKVHRVVQFAGFAIAVAGFILALIMTAKDNHFKTKNGHAQLGLTVMILGIIQIAVAIFRPNPASVGQNKSIIRVLWEFSHWWIGRLALLLAVATIFLGLNQIQAPMSYTIAWAVLVGLSASLIACLELYRKFAIDRPQQAYEFVKLSQTDPTN